MASVTPQNTKVLYSWWWNSHISPKNSKWLQDTLSDMDGKVEQMIKLLEDDADSFARRAEMYYKQRPELLKLVEEFYRSYRSLAERYDNATVVLQQAHRSLAEAFPSQVPLTLDDSPSGSDPRTPDTSSEYPPLRPDTSGSFAKNYAACQESDHVTGRRGLKNFNELFDSGGRARKVLTFDDINSKGVDGKNNGSHESRTFHDSERLKSEISKLESEKEAALIQYQQALKKLSSVEADVKVSKNESKGFEEKAVKCEEKLHATLAKMGCERESAQTQLQNYKCKVSELEEAVSLSKKNVSEAEERVGRSEMEGKTLRQELKKLASEKDDALLLHSKLLEKMSELELNLQHAVRDAQIASERAEKAEMEIQITNQESARLSEEKESIFAKYRQCVEVRGLLESQLDDAKKEKQKLSLEIDACASKVKSVEERCSLLESLNQSMHSELESSLKNMEAKGVELKEKQQELSRVWNSLEEERMKFVEAETAFQTLQHLHSQSQIGLTSLSAEVQKRDRILEDLEAYNQRLHTEVEHITAEHTGLNEIHLSSVLTIQELEVQNNQLKDTISKLESEVDLRVDQRNALQQDIYCLKEVANELNKNYEEVVGELESLGFSRDNFQFRLKSLMEDNSQLNEICERFKNEKDALLVKLSEMEKLVQEKLFLTNSLSDLNVELEAVREKVQKLEESCQSLAGEKSTLVSQNLSLASQVQTGKDYLVKVMEQNSSFEKLIQETQYSVETLQAKFKSSENQCSRLECEKSDLATAKEYLATELNASEKNYKNLKTSYQELENKKTSLEKENESLLNDVEQLRASYCDEKQKHETLMMKSKGLEDSCLLLENEKSELHERNQKFIGDVESVGFRSDNLVFHLKEMIEANIQLKKDYERGRGENSVLVEKLFDMDKHVEEKHSLMTSLSDLNHELEILRRKVNLLEESYESLHGEKSAIVVQNSMLASQLETSNENLANAMERACHMEKSLTEVHASSEKIQEKLRELEDLNSVLENEKSSLLSSKESIITELEDSKQNLESLSFSYRTLEENKNSLEKERESLHKNIEELRACIGAEKEEHEFLKVKSKGLEDSCLLLENEKCELKDKHHKFVGVVESFGLCSDNFAYRLKEMITENAQLKEDRERDRGENGTLVEKLSVMDKLVEENALLICSLSGLNVELESVRKSTKLSEEACHTLMRDKTALLDQNFSLESDLLVFNQSLIQAMEMNMSLQKSLSKERSAVEMLRIKVSSMKSLYPLLKHLKSDLITLKEYLIIELDTSQKAIASLNASYSEFERKTTVIEKEKESLVREVIELKDSSYAGKQRYDKVVDKVKILEESLLFLENKNVDLVVMKDFLTSVIKESDESLKNLNTIYKYLESKYASLEKQRSSSLREMDELNDCLATEKQERSHHTALSESKLAAMAISTSKLRDELLVKSQELDTEIEKGLDSQIENFVLEQSVRDASRKNFALSFECQELVEASLALQSMIMKLEGEKAKSKLEMTSVSDQLNLLRQALYKVLIALDTNADGTVEKDTDLVSLILNKVEETQEILAGLNDENQKLVMENSLLVTLLREFQLEVVDIVNAKRFFQQELSSKSEEVSFWQSAGARLTSEKEELNVKLFESKQGEEDALRKLSFTKKKLLESQGALHNLESDKKRVHEEQRGLLISVSDLTMEKQNLKEEWLGLLSEALCQGTLSLILKDSVVQGSNALNELTGTLDKVVIENDALKENAVVMNAKLQVLNTMKLKVAEFLNIVGQVRRHCQEVEVVPAGQQTPLNQCEDSDLSQYKPSRSFQDLQILEHELLELQGDLNAVRCMINILSNELQSQTVETKTMEDQTESLLVELQFSVVYIAVLEGKISELADLYAKLEEKNLSDGIEINWLKERAIMFDAEREKVNAQMLTHVTAATSLFNAITHLENHIASKKELPEVDEQEQEVCEERAASSFDEPTKFLDLQTRLKNVATTVLENERRLVLENETVSSKLQESLKQIEELKLHLDSQQAVGKTKSTENNMKVRELKSKQQKNEHEITEEASEIIPKDIVLDQISESSSYGVSKRETYEDDDPMLRLWETSNQAGSFTGFVSKRTGSFASVDSLSQELRVDKLEISKTFSGSFWDGKKILERLDSDEEKLSNLNVDVQNLKAKVEVAENKKEDDVEYHVVKEQLEESEQAIKRLSELNKKLKKTVEDDLPTFDEKALQSSAQATLLKRRKVTDQARRGSEKIGRLQLEVKKLQFLLTKLDDANISKGKALVPERNSRVPLRDFLYGKTRTDNGKGHYFCSCLRPQSQGD